MGTRICRHLKSLMWVGLGFALLAGCAGQATRLNSLSFQNGQGLSNEQILLKNIIAAAHQRTPTFVAASQVSSNVDAKGSLSANFSIPDTGHSLNPMISGGRSQNVTILDYGATKAARYLYEPVHNSYLRQLRFQGWSAELIETVLYAGIYVHPDLRDIANEKFEETCHSDRRYYEICNWVKKKVGECGDPFEIDYEFLNTAETRCDYFNFQVVLFKLATAGVNWQVRQEQVHDKEGKPVFEKDGQPKIGTQLVDFIGDPEINALKRSLELENEELKKRGERTVHVLGVALRSPAQIIEFLGRLAALQLYLDPPFVARSPLWQGGSIVPFRVVRGRDPEGLSAVSVRVGGRTYDVPQPDPLYPDEDHQSLRVMALVIELQNRARQEAPIQGNTIAIVQ